MARGESYEEFVKKFKPKHTTDDCYTPAPLYDAVLGWVMEQCPQIRDLRVMRPFYPGGDFEAEDYTGAVVIDNPPFSIAAKIQRWYQAHDVPFFLFANSLTLFSLSTPGVCAIITDSEITYENGAHINTGFVSNLFPGVAVRLCPDLRQRIADAMRSYLPDKSKRRNKYPANVISAALLSKYVKRGLSLDIKRNEVHKISALKAQKEKGVAIYGGGYLISDRIADVLSEAMARDVIVCESTREENTWSLSEEERAIVDRLNEAAI